MRKTLCIIFFFTCFFLDSQSKSVGFFSLRPHAPIRTTDYDQYGVTFRLGGGMGGNEKSNTPVFFGGMHWHYKFIGFDYTAYIGSARSTDPVTSSAYTRCSVRGRSITLGGGFYGRFFSVFAGSGFGNTISGYELTHSEIQNQGNYDPTYRGNTRDATLKICVHGRSVGGFVQSFYQCTKSDKYVYGLVAGLEFGLMQSREFH